MRRSDRFPLHSRSVLAQIYAERARGDPLDDGLRRSLERSFDLDLSAIRIHVDPVANRLTRGLRADAFASGAHLFFRDGSYQPCRATGLKLLAHEVAHAIQQTNEVVSQSTPFLNEPDGPWEIQADRAADRVVAGKMVHFEGCRASVLPSRPDRPMVIQCHESYEHRALGDVPTTDIVAIAAFHPNRNEILERETKLMRLWHDKPETVTDKQITDICPWIRTIRLAQSDLLVTYGELNALPDYIANAPSLDSCPRDVLLPILQVIRQESYQRLNILRGVSTNDQFADAPFKPDQSPIGAVNKLLATWQLDSLTRNLGISGIDHYGGLLARNACHFAPYTWHRWQAAYLVARDYAKLAHDTGDANEKARLRRLAWTYHGYADHFLHDSFAAGHLINKTLVMQWFVQWAATSHLPIEDWDLFKNVTVQNQPGLAGRQLYDPSYDGHSTDPQTVEEQASYAERLGLSGVVAQGSDDKNATYQQYLTFLSSAITQLTSNAIHDYYNSNSLWVASKANPTPYQVWGDDTLFSKDPNPARPPGAQFTSETAQLSQQSIHELLNGGQSKITTQLLRDRFPTNAGDSSSVVPLQTWVDSKEQWTKDNIFNNWEMFAKRILSQGFPRVQNFSKDQEFSNKWTTSLPDSRLKFTDTLTINGRLFAGSAGLVFELNPDNGDVLQSHQVMAQGSEIHIATDGTSLFVGCNGYVYGAILDGWDKATWWITGMTGLSSQPVTVLYAGGRLFAGSNGMVHELDPAKGTLLKHTKVSSTVGEYVHLATDGQTLFAGCHGYVYGIKLQNDWTNTGYTWYTGMKGASYSPVTVLCSAGKVFAGSNGVVHELDSTSGALLNYTKISDSVGEGVHLTTDGQTLFAGCHGYAYGIRLNDWSKTAWGTPMSGVLWKEVRVVYYNGHLYAGSNGFVLNLNANTGEVLKSLRLSLPGPDWGDFTPALVLDEKRGLFVGMHGYVYNVTL